MCHCGSQSTSHRWTLKIILTSVIVSHTRDTHLWNLFLCFHCFLRWIPERGLLVGVYNCVKAFCMCRQIAFQEGIPDGVSTQAWRDPSAGTVEYAWVFNFGKEWWGGKGEGFESSRDCWTDHYFYNIHISKNNLFFLLSPYQTKTIATTINDNDIIGWDRDTQHTAHGSASQLFLSVDGNSTG